MKKRRIVKWSGIVLAAIVVVTIAVLYILDSRVPTAYRPAQLGLEERMLVRDRFWHHILQFNQKAHRPFDWVITERQLNEYLASMEEIEMKVSARARSGRLMERAGIAEPVVAVGDGILTVMLLSTRHDKVFSADLSLTFTEEGRLRIRVEQVRIGALPVPRSLVHDRLQQLKGALTQKSEDLQAAKKNAPPAGTIGGVSPGDLAAVLTRVVAAINEEPIPTDFEVPLARMRVRVKGIDMLPRTEDEEARIVLHVVPVAPVSAGD